MTTNTSAFQSNGFATSDIKMPVFDPRNLLQAGDYRVRWGEATTSALRLALNPDDTGRFGSMINALAGPSFKRYVDRMMRTPEGQTLMREQPDLLAALRDRDRLWALPEGTLGHEYAKFAHAENLSGDVLADVLMEYVDPKYRHENRSAEEGFFAHWGRDMHDLMHLVLGYHTDILGEIGVLTFAGVQSGDMGVLAAMGAAQLYVAYNPSGRKLAVDAISRARKARPFMIQNWVKLLDVQIDEIREYLNVGVPPTYKPMFTGKRDVDASAHEALVH